MIYKIIIEATGCTEVIAGELAQIMEHQIFHFALDWQTKPDLEKAAKEALIIYNNKNLSK